MLLSLLTTAATRFYRSFSRYLLLCMLYYDRHGITKSMTALPVCLLSFLNNVPFSFKSSFAFSLSGVHGPERRRVVCYACTYKTKCLTVS
jgi:hypothetical protein